ncbi:response regulator [Planctomycetota bacterium]
MVNTRVLLVDDEEEFLAFLGRRLKKRGFDVWTAANGLDGLRHLDEHPIDVVILDVKMPGLGGMETLRNIKLKQPLVEIIMLTGHGLVELAVEGLKLGAFDYVTKPCDISVLIGKIHDAEKKKKGVEEKTRKAKTEQIIRHPLAIFDGKKE